MGRYDRQKTRVAKKEHKCEQCTGIITPGKEYLHCDGVSDNHWYSYKLCLPCNTVLNTFSDILLGDDGELPHDSIYALLSPPYEDRELWEEVLELAKDAPGIDFIRSFDQC